VRILVVTPYPPVRDGIAAYAVQSVAALRARGDDVEVLSPGPSAAHHHLDLTTSRGLADLARRVRGYDRVIVQFHPEIFYPAPSTARRRVRTSLALAAVFRAAREVEVVLHEIDYRTGRPATPEGRAARLLWRGVDRITVHTDGERADFVQAFGVRPERVVVLPHGADFVRRTEHDRVSARRSLGLRPDVHVFLAIGFLQPHKGFDRAIRAFAGIDPERAELWVVGSVRVEEPAYVQHRVLLEQLAAATPGAHVVAGYLSDERFDRWLVAADTVVLPYRHIWSSGVLERAALYDRPVIVSVVGGLEQQAEQHQDVQLVRDDRELQLALRAAVRAGGEQVVVARSGWPTGGDVPLHGAVQAEVRRRAAVLRGSAPAGLLDGPAVGGAVTGGASAPVRRVPPLVLPVAASTNATAARVKRVVRKLTAWQLEPVVGQLNALQAATVDALDRADDRGRGESPVGER
jgi:glycosyltransferase involved in cell wall biosynthesis